MNNLVKKAYHEANISKKVTFNDILTDLLNRGIKIKGQVCSIKHIHYAMYRQEHLKLTHFQKEVIATIKELKNERAHKQSY